MKLAKFREVVAKGEVEFKVKTSLNAYFNKGTIVTLFEDSGSIYPWFVLSKSDDGRKQLIGIHHIKRLKKNKRKGSV